MNGGVVEHDGGGRSSSTRRLRLLVRGVVQGVGFRPFVSALAYRLALGGFVRNVTDGVSLEIEGEPLALDRFVHALHHESPSLARIANVERSACEPLGEHLFRIEESRASVESRGVDGAVVVVTPDAATCDDCLRELFDPNDRRHHHAFINCTSCGPRLTIMRSAPYDRDRTTMAAFPMCASCRAEYEDPTNRRFHAQPIACPACGPQVELVDGAGVRIQGEEGHAPITIAARAIARGAIIAVKGLGGYHLACSAENEEAVQRLRRGKQRDAKPFALLVSSIDAAAQLCDVSDEERALLLDRTRPIVLLRRRRRRDNVAPSVAPGQARLGVMLPYTPIHHLLAREAGVVLVMTSGNISDEPIAFRDDDAVERLGPFVDLILRHDRPIHTRCEDSIAHVVDGAPAVLRRSRGYAPAPLTLPRPLSTPTLALGGHLKSVFALGVGDRAFSSHHFGDLDHFEAWRSFREGLDHYQSLLRITPTRVVHDLHPDYATTALALELERTRGVERIAVQHHEAHVASCLAEHRHDGPAIGVAFDGAGYGRDGSIWGGEVFTVANRGGGAKAFDLQRRAHLRAVPMPGGDRAACEPWRMAVSYLLDAEIDVRSSPIAARFDVESVARIARTSLSPRTSSIGRLFDAVAAIAGMRASAENLFEAQAAMELQAVSEDDGAVRRDPYPFALSPSSSSSEPLLLEIDPRPMFRAIVEDVLAGNEASTIGRRFHETLASMVVATCMRLRDEAANGENRPEHVALTGGVFANALLLNLCSSRLGAEGFTVLRHRDVPSNDGGLAFGQLALVVDKNRGG